MVLHRVHHQILRSHHLFEPLNDEQMDELMGTSHLLSVDKGEPLFRQGEPADAVYVVTSGSLGVCRHHEAGVARAPVLGAEIPPSQPLPLAA